MLILPSQITRTLLVSARDSETLEARTVLSMASAQTGIRSTGLTNPMDSWPRPAGRNEITAALLSAAKGERGLAP